MSFEDIGYSQKYQTVDFYFFINPIGDSCLTDGKEINKFMDDHPEIKFTFRYIPVHNLQTVDHFMKVNNLPANDVALRNKIFRTIYQVSLAYLASLLQGRKKGRLFLSYLQSHLGTDIDQFSFENIISIAKDAKFDISMLIEDMESSLVLQDFKKNQKLAHEMGIYDTPSLVVYTSDDEDYGYKITNEEIHHSLLEEILIPNQPKKIFSILK